VFVRTASNAIHPLLSLDFLRPSLPSEPRQSARLLSEAHLQLTALSPGPTGSVPHPGHKTRFFVFAPEDGLRITSPFFGSVAIVSFFAS